jgi:hypothetical protein
MKATMLCLVACVSVLGCNPTHWSSTTKQVGETDYKEVVCSDYAECAKAARGVCKTGFVEKSWSQSPNTEDGSMIFQCASTMCVPEVK